jgi:glycosyltransferase involved in cell wall biosynthesis
MPTSTGGTRLAAVAAVDVRIPVMGRASYVGGAIESVLDQSFPDWSLLVSENGMPDPDVAKALLPYLSDARVRHVRVGDEISAAAHHNRLVQTGEAAYVAVLHDDDRWHPDVLRDRVGALEQDGRCALAFGGARVVDGAGRELQRVLPELAEGVLEPPAFAPFLYGGNVVHVSATLLRRSALEAVDGAFLDAYPMFDDHELWFRLAVRFPVAYLRRCDVDLRRHDAQLSLDRRLRAEERLRLLDRFDRLLAAQLPGAVDEARRHEVRAQVLLSSALDEIERGDARRARRLVGEAAAERPASLLGAKGLAAALGAIGGGPGRRAVEALRRREERRRPFA